MTASAARFWDRIADRYARRPVPDEAVYQEKLRLTQELLPPGAQVLEIGCGTGSTALAHAPHAGSVLAADISPRMIAVAREKAAAAGVGNVEFRVAGLDNLEASEGGFDAVLALSLLHLLEDPEAALARARAWLKPGGVFVSSTACLADDMPWMRWLLPVLRRLGVAPYVNVLSETDLVAALARQGFEIERRWKPGKRQALFLIARRPG